jgi:hypothetical protein
MTYRVKLVKGLLAPERNRYHLHEAETVTHLKRKMILLYLFSVLVFGLYGFLGIGSESFSKELLELGASEFEMGKLFILAGNLVAGIVYPTVYLFLISLFLWVLTDIDYVKLLMVQMIVFILQLLEKILLLPFFVFMHVNYDANPFSLGIIGQYFTSNEYVIHLFSEISLFQIVVIAIQYYYLHKFTEKNKYTVLLIIISGYVILWLINALLAYIKVAVFV